MATLTVLTAAEQDIIPGYAPVFPLLADKVAELLEKGMAPVTERGAGRTISVFSFTPNLPAYGLGFRVRDYNRDYLELGEHAQSFLRS